MVTGAVAAAYALCEGVAREHYENFPVASLLLPARMRPHVAAVYAFARVADDFADEGTRPEGERLRLLDDWQARLRAAASGAWPPDVRLQGPEPASSIGPGAGTGGPDIARRESGPAGLGDGARLQDGDRIFLALGDTMRRCRLPAALFEDLLSAFRQDVTTNRYPDFAAVLDYCRRSANPVGRLVLRIAGLHEPRLDEASDGLCSALQLTNFWQDLGRDWARGRLYVPADEMRRAGADEHDLDRGRLTPAWVAVMTSLAARTRALFDRGRAVCDGVGGRLGLELRLTWLGGRRILDRLERGRFDVFTARPSLGPLDVAAMALGAARWRRQGLLSGCP